MMLTTTKQGPRPRPGPQVRNATACLLSGTFRLPAIPTDGAENLREKWDKSVDVAHALAQLPLRHVDLARHILVVPRQPLQAQHLSDPQEPLAGSDVVAILASTGACEARHTIMHPVPRPAMHVHCNRRPRRVHALRANLLQCLLQPSIGLSTGLDLLPGPAATRKASAT